MKPSHIKESEHGMNCMHCGGVVDEDGLVPLGEAEQFEAVEGAETDQHEAVEKMRDETGFTEALGRRGYAEGGVVDDDYVDMGNHQIRREDMGEGDWAKAQQVAKSRPLTPEQQERSSRHAESKQSPEDKAFFAASPQMQAQFKEAKAGEVSHAEAARREELKKKKSDRYAMNFGSKR